SDLTQVRLQVASRADDGGEAGFKAALVLQVCIDSRAQVLVLRLQRDHAGRVTLGLGVVVLGSPGCLDEAEDRGGVHRSDELGVSGATTEGQTIPPSATLLLDSGVVLLAVIRNPRSGCGCLGLALQVVDPVTHRFPLPAPWPHPPARTGCARSEPCAASGPRASSSPRWSSRGHARGSAAGAGNRW